MTKTFARGEKRSTAVSIVKSATAGTSIEAILSQISQAIDVDMAGAKSYYAYIVKNGLAAGPALTKTPKTKAPKSKEMKLGKILAETLGSKKSDKGSKPTKTLDEVKNLKAKNLETIRKTSASYSQKLIDKMGDGVDTSDVSDSDVPKFLTKDTLRRDYGI